MPTTAHQIDARPLAEEFLAWQVELRAATMNDRQGMPHAGVAPLLTVKRPPSPLGVSTHSIICGILPRRSDLERKTAEFRALYEANAPKGARAVYDEGIAYLRGYYGSREDFAPSSVTTLLDGDSDLVRALAAEPRCQLVFYVFDLQERSNVGRFRCLTLEAVAEIHRSGPVFENVWWHNTLFHGKLEGAAVIEFHHQATYDTGWGKHDRLA
jgi:hypothetical protein